MKKVLHQLFNRNPQLRILAFHGKEAPFTIKKGNQEKLLAYTGEGMSPPPLSTSQSLKSSLISLKVANLAPCSASSFFEVHTQELSVVIIFFPPKKKSLSNLCKSGLNRAKKN